MGLPKRKNIRLKDYNYSQNGAYFVTICTQGRLDLFGEVVGDGFPVPLVKLNSIGEIVKRFSDNISNRYEYTNVEKYVIMPNHIHMIVIISNIGTGNPSPTMGSIIGWFKYQTTKNINSLYDNAGKRIWQRSYHDHIIRNETEYQKIWQYIDENPAKWAEDCYYTV